jgi:hypothetical protein
MKKQMILLLTPVLLLSLAACTKKLDYKTEFKEKVQGKDLISTTDVYVYQPSMANSSRTDAGARPYWMGEEKLVKLRWTENALQIVQVEKDPRFQGNSANDKLVISVPVEHIEYRCAPDKYGQCTNKEEKNMEINWMQKSQFKPDFSNMKVTETNLLPMEMEKVFGGKCYSEQASNLLDATIENDAINVRVEKTYHVDLKCLAEAESLDELLSNSTVTAVFHYSLAKLNSVSSKGYQAAQYPSEDSRTFGFFTTTTKSLDVDFNNTVFSKGEFINRWNPDRKEIVYYLVDEFNKPENALLK